MNATLITLTLSLAISQADAGFVLEPGFKLLLNGKDLTGWRYSNGPAFDGKANASDGRYSAKDGKIIVNPGKGTAQMWTVQEFPTDFHLKLEFRAEVNADSGVFIREPQFVGQTKDRLATEEAAKWVEGAVRDHFDNWLANDTKSAGAILDFLVLRAEERLRRASGVFMDLLEERFTEWGLTKAERDVALFAIKGMSTAEIAVLRATSEGTVKAQTNAIYRKAGVTGRSQLLSLFIDDLMRDEGTLRPAGRDQSAA